MRVSIRRAIPWLLVALVAGCASPIERAGDQYRHRRHGFLVHAPQGATGPWERVGVEGATLAFRGPEAETMILKSRCGRPVAAAQLMARHLLIGLAEREVVDSRPVQVAGESAWLQVVDTEQAGRTVRLKTVTLVVNECSFDLLFAAGLERYPVVEPVFDAWWADFQLVSVERGA